MEGPPCPLQMDTQVTYPWEDEELTPSLLRTCPLGPLRAPQVAEGPRQQGRGDRDSADVFAQTPSGSPTPAKTNNVEGASNLPGHPLVTHVHAQGWATPRGVRAGEAAAECGPSLAPLCPQQDTQRSPGHPPYRDTRTCTHTQPHIPSDLPSSTGTHMCT